MAVCTVSSQFSTSLRGQRMPLASPSRMPSRVQTSKRLTTRAVVEEPKTPKKGLKRSEEPKQYWQTAEEKSGKGPMSTILPYIAIFGFATPFIILGLAFANGWIRTP